MQPRPAGVNWQTSSYSMQNPIRDCVQCGTPETGSTRYLGDSMTPDAGVIRLGAGEMLAFLRTAAA